MAFGGVAFSGTEQMALSEEEERGGEKNSNTSPVRPPVLRRGLARALVVAIDWGVSMTQTEPAPLRSAFLLEQMTAFVNAFFSANPLSQLSLVCTGAGTAERLSPLVSAKSAHLAALAQLAGKECDGEISLQHCVELGVATRFRACFAGIASGGLVAVDVRRGRSECGRSFRQPFANSD